MFFVAARNDQILYSRPTHLKTTICYPFTATSGWVDSSSNIGPSIYYHTPSITQYSFFPSYQSFLPKIKHSRQPCPPTTMSPNSPQLHPTTMSFPPLPPTCWSNLRSRDSHAKHNDSRSPGHFDKPPGGGWSKAKAPEGRAHSFQRVSDLDRTPQGVWVAKPPKGFFFEIWGRTCFNRRFCFFDGEDSISPNLFGESVCLEVV